MEKILLEFEPIIHLTQIFQPKLDLKIQTEVYFVSLVIRMGHLVVSNGHHLVFCVLLNLLISLLSFLERIMLRLALNFMQIIDTIKLNNLVNKIMLIRLLLRTHASSIFRVIFYKAQAFGLSWGVLLFLNYFEFKLYI